MKNFAWQAPEYAHSAKTSDWYWTVGIITAALAVTSIIFGNALFAGVIIIGVFALVMFASRRPNIVAVRVNDKGIEVDRTLYLYASLESFALDEVSKHAPRLILASKKLVMPPIAVPAPIDPVERENLHAFIAENLKEVDFKQGIMQALLDRAGF